jgi:hypothetical protein
MREENQEKKERKLKKSEKRESWKKKLNSTEILKPNSNIFEEI